MEQSVQSGLVTTFSFEIEDDDWDDWKETVPRTKTLDERIRELIRADAEGRVQEATND